MTTTLTACLSHCHDGCALLAERQEDGRIRLRGHPDHPFTAGFCCAKMQDYVQQTLQRPDRIVTPLIKQDGQFHPASWEEAMDLIAAQLTALRDTPERILHHIDYASFGVLHRASEYIFGRLGAAGLAGGSCVRAMGAAIVKDFGVQREPHWSTALAARRIVLWGRNLAAQTPHAGRVLLQARKKGISVLAIHPGDPGYTPFADQTIRIRPGSDRFLAAAALKILKDTGRLDQNALARCTGADALVPLLDAHSLDALAAACDVSPESIHLLADWMADAPVHVVLGRGLQRYALGGENVRWVNALAMCSGNIGREGGGISFAGGDKGHVSYGWTKAPADMPRRRTLPFAALGQALETAEPPVTFVWTEGWNPVATAPDAARIAQALRGRFHVAVEPFMTDTAACATVILPPALLFEREDIARAAGHDFVMHGRPLPPEWHTPPAGVRSNFQIQSLLAARLGMDFPDADTVLAEALQTATPAGTLAALRSQGWLAAQPQPVPWADGQFATKNGRFHLVRTLTPEPPAPDGYPLRLLTFVERESLLSRRRPEQMQDLPVARIAPESPCAAALDPARPARLVTPLGSMAVRLALRPGLHPEGVLVPRGGWLSRGWGINALIEPREADLGGQAAYYAQWCRLEQES
ncbi:molybdopterin-dependent oxidoreductase [Megalodesulfovibrio gigas]|uniref:Putative Nitrate reductase n=1 Tax=Megalodesulfovibrio gigas (strain ATCC 19364 / DSM 1382 / NCIMB 9332 / VKM B-1759) TaxID=1121448 RepID=T2G9W5_MEGG1|nr:molybdopterin-dependent oxidoreductase [Megalodesulfovibrio gigas]AGW12974.1 putative Nitrate reductase [Megalodesulfovibrio gigas DSM 1382 = ATCC 19364]